MTDNDTPSLRARPGRAPIRQQMAEPVRDEDLRDEPRKTRKRKGNVDQFHIPPEMIPPGVTYEWKRATVYGQADPSYDVSLRENGWDPVDVSRHPQFMPAGYSGPITRSGMILMERPSHLTEEARAEDNANALDAIRTKEQQLGATPPGTMTRDHATARPKVGRSFAPIPVSE